MSFGVRIINETDYHQTLVGWWKDWRWTPPAADFLPSFGVMVYKGDVDVCAGYLYATNSKVAWIEFIVSNFQYKDADRKEAIELLINELSGYAERAGFKYIYSSLKSQPLIKTYKKCGFQTGSENCTELIKIL